ncbi:hypothetical protein FACS1894102_3160 [Spirochaetia bacterium]|nr:hypothetical protein FACS1894102_3160 [Spirochaetia bacterium]
MINRTKNNCFKVFIYTLLLVVIVSCDPDPADSGENGRMDVREPIIKMTVVNNSSRKLFVHFTEIEKLNLSINPHDSNTKQVQSESYYHNRSNSSWYTSVLVYEIKEDDEKLLIATFNNDSKKIIFVSKTSSADITTDIISYNLEITDIDID